MCQPPFLKLVKSLLVIRILLHARRGYFNLRYWQHLMLTRNKSEIAKFFVGEPPPHEVHETVAFEREFNPSLVHDIV